MCASHRQLHCSLLTACLFCVDCRVTMYDYQAMCKVPYHHHSGARPLLSVRICQHAALSGLGSGGLLLEHLQHLDVAQSPKELSSCLLSSGGNVQTHVRQISEALVATDSGFQFGTLLACRISQKHQAEDRI